MEGKTSRKTVERVVKERKKRRGDELMINLTETVQAAITTAINQLSEKELRDHNRCRTELADILKWMQARKVGFLAPKPRSVSEEFLPNELIEYLQSDYCKDKEILIPYNWNVDCDHWKSTGENRNFWHIVKVSLNKGVPMPSVEKSAGLGSSNTWERGRD
ncbi:MAG: hypothetical protein ACKPE3_13285 [Sphaerospermopsis kisseleviana]